MYVFRNVEVTEALRAIMCRNTEENQSDYAEDMQLLYLVEDKIGRDAVIAELDRLCGEPLTFKDYPRNTKFFSDLYDFIFKTLEK